MLSQLDTRKSSLNNLGLYIPSVSRLVLTDGHISEIRELGAKFSNLTCLFINGCQLRDLEGIGSISPTLSTVSLQNNLVTDLEPLSLLETLTTLDLRINRISDVEQLDYLRLCPNLEKIWISDNPIVAGKALDQIIELEESMLSTSYSNDQLHTDILVPNPPCEPEAASSSAKSARRRKVDPRSLPRDIRVTTERNNMIPQQPTGQMPVMKRSIRVAYRMRT